jgi:predicted cobalt transporter CbtA
VRALRTALVSATLAGLVAGTLTAGFHAVFTEPVIDQAIAAEEAREATSGHSHGTPVVSRRGQKIGLVVGLLLYGAVWGLVVGIGVHLTRDWAPPEWRHGRRGLVFAGLTGWSVALFPFLKYPANPPGVGEADTIGYRQILYVGFIALSVLGLWLAVTLYRRRDAITRGAGAWIGPVIFYAAWAFGLYVLMPPNPDPVPLSAAIVFPFRVLSLAGLAVFWAALGMGLAVLARAEPVARRRLAR